MTGVLAFAMSVWALLRSEDAHKIAMRTEARAVERNAVSWTIERARVDRVTVTNEGLDAALDVTVVVGIEGQSWTVERSAVAVGEAVEVVAALVDRRLPQVRVPVQAEFTVTWRTPAGRWREHRGGPVVL